MTGFRRIPSPLLAVALVVTTIAACDAREDAPGADAAAGPEAGASAAAEGATTSAAVEAVPADAQIPSSATLPALYELMIGLQRDADRISRGLWAEAYDSIAKGAEAIAAHPHVPPEEAQRIAGVLGEEMSGFQGMDGTVHDIAVRMAGAARDRDLARVLQADEAMRQGCVACHTAFRDRLREALAPGQP